MYTTLKIGIIVGILIAGLILITGSITTEIEVESDSPAAKYCLENDGLPMSEFAETPDGQTFEKQFCQFQDGSMCPLDEFYTGNCIP
ncbi:MAG: DUF333 domain-containing protein [Nitrosopumilaceae archaeon]|nr:DUF333 domain-containing protein [Nitrosopumilaceae archaeon]